MEAPSSLSADNDTTINAREQPYAVNEPNNLDGKPIMELDGESLTCQKLVDIGKGLYKIKISEKSVEAVSEGRKVIDRIVEEKRTVYGITTGFGKFASVVIEDMNKLGDLQCNLIRSHAAGTGKILSPNKVAMLLALRINVLAKGYSGVRLETLDQLVDAFNNSCLPYVPEQGTVGASGDLAPLAHLALGLMGEGKMWCDITKQWSPSIEVLHSKGLRPIKLQAKEGLALINGTQLITSLCAEATHRAQNIARQADVVAALTLEVLKGTSKAFDKDVHAIRNHSGQGLVARRLRSLLHSDFHQSQIAVSHRFCNRVQDAYTLRCCPQVHGIVHDTIQFVNTIIQTELNSATDNPIVFSSRDETVSAGNFHGEYPAKASDYLAIAVSELGSISERRIERLVNPSLSVLPAFLVEEGGFNSGFMIAHCTAAALVSENKCLSHPASVDSLSTSGGTEDHVSMGGFAARKALQVVRNIENIIAIELLAACQAIEFLRPMRTTKPLEAVYELVRTKVKNWDVDRYMSPDIAAIKKLLKGGEIWKVVEDDMMRYNNRNSSHGSASLTRSEADHSPFKQGEAEFLPIRDLEKSMTCKVLMEEERSERVPHRFRQRSSHQHRPSVSRQPSPTSSHWE